MGGREIASALGPLRIAVATTALAAAIGAAPVSTQPASATAEEVSPDFAESAALVGWSADGGDEISVRVARFPGRGQGTLWLSLFHGDMAYSVALDPVPLGEDRARTPVERSEAAFAVGGSLPTAAGRPAPGHARLACRARDTEAMVCTVEAESLSHPTPHPPEGAGTLPIRLTATFTASHRGVVVRPGRLEVFGLIEATVETPEGSRRLELPGKWHEQTGERPRFAAAFTYFSITGAAGSLLAMSGSAGVTGFAVLDGPAVAVRAFTIDPIGPGHRRFTVTLADGRAISGATTIMRETSVPIEGQRRPGATVTVETSVGPMIGHLNDWNPVSP